MLAFVKNVIGFYLSGIDVMFYLDWVVKLFIFEHVSGVKLGWKRFFFLPFLFNLVGDYSYKIELVCAPLYIPLMIYAFSDLRKQFSLREKIFYGFYPYIIDELFISLMAIYARYLFQWTAKEMSQTLWMSFVLIALLYPVYRLVIYILRIDFNEARRNIIASSSFVKFFDATNISMILYLLTIVPLNFYEYLSWRNPGFYFHSRFYLNNLHVLYFILFIFLISYLNYLIKESKTNEIIGLKDRQLLYISQYSYQIEELYKELRSFRHDYTNLLVSLDVAIKDRDIDTIEKIYNDVLADSGKQFSDEKYDYANLVNVENSALKSILSAKLLEARDNGLTVHVEIPGKIDKPNMNTIDFITVISIFLDNAIEAACETETKELSFAYYRDGDSIYTIIANSTVGAASIKEIYREGFSTKGDNRGLGLYNVRHILHIYKNASLITKNENGIFTQELKIKD